MNRTTHVTLVALCAVALAGSAAAQSGRARPAAPAAPAATPAPEPVPEASPKPAERSAPKPVEAKFDTKYAGGTVGFDKDAKVKLTIKDGVVTFATKNAHYDIPAEKITDMSYGQNVRQRLAEGIGVGSVIPGLGGIVGRSKSTAHYIEIVWDVPPTGGLALRVDKDDYRGLIAALEGTTGLKVRVEAQPGPIDWP